MNFKAEKNFITRVIIVCIAALCVGFIIYNFKSISEKLQYTIGVLSPFFIAIFISYLLSRPLSFLQTRLKLKRLPAIIIVYSLFIGFSILAAAYIIPLVIEAGIKLGVQLANSVGGFGDLFKGVDLGPLEAVFKQNLDKITTLVSEFSSSLITHISNFFFSLTSTFLNFVLAVIISLYMLLDKEKILGVFKRLNEALFTDRRSDALEAFFQSVNSVFAHFLRGLIVEAFVVSIITYVALSLLGVRYTIALAATVLILYLIPTIGLVLSMVPIVISVLTYDPIKAIWALVVMIAIQQLDGNFLAPRIMGNSVGLDPFWIILSIMVFGALMGLPGVIFAIPFAAIVKTTAIKYLEKKENEEKF